MYTIEKEINSIIEYIDFIFEYKTRTGDELWYRGHRNNQWLLDASLYREKVMAVQSLGTSEIASLNYRNIIDFTKELNVFKGHLEGHIPEEFNNFHLMFLGQHYGLKTPALDWSTDPLVALYFALDGYVKNPNVYPVVFILKPGKLNANSWIKWKGTEPITEPLIVDYLNNDIFNEWFSDVNHTPFSFVPLAVKSNLDISYRIARQSGVFTLLDTRQPLHYPWIQTKVNEEPFGITVKINPKAVEDIRMHLTALDITRSTIYGKSHKDWDELCEEIVKQTPIL